ncbi:MAG: hypothetical protein ABFS10_01580 [Bacteroidota bacterium]
MTYRNTLLLIIAIIAGGACTQNPTEYNGLEVNLEYAPEWWQTAIGLPDDHMKTVVGKEGQMYYDFVRVLAKRDKHGPFRGFRTEFYLQLPETCQWKDQQIASPKIPIVETLFESNSLQIQQSSFTVAPAFVDKLSNEENQYLGVKAQRDYNSNDSIIGAPRNDISIVKYVNNGEETIVFSPVMHINTVYNFEAELDGYFVNIGEHLKVKFSQKIVDSKVHSKKLKVFKDSVEAFYYTLTLDQIELKPGEEQSFTYGVNAGQDPVIVPNSVEQAESLKQSSNNYWANLDLPYNKISVPDQGIQNIVNSSVRNIFQARENDNGMLSFQVGPTVYRGLWVVDGAFLLESMTFLDQKRDVRNGIEYLMGYQNADGSFEMIKDHWKETGIVLWAVSNHAKLTGDKEWLESNWSKMERAFDYIDTMRTRASVDTDAPNYGLIPAGNSDGGLWGLFPEYTNIYWSLNGMKAAIESAKWLNKESTADKWQKEYDEFYALFRKAAERDMKVDEFGNDYLPVRMEDPDNVLPQKAQWAFLHSIFPGKIYPEDDDLVKANMKMLKAVEREGLTYNTGWHNDGVWNYFPSFMGHALLWNHKGDEAVKKLYAMANHVSPTLAWREEQSVKTSDFSPVGDMPHNWASAEFIRLVRHLIALERGGELHLFEGLPKEWTNPGMKTELNGVLTHFGVLSLKLSVSDNGKEADLFVDMEEYKDADLSNVILHTKNIDNNEEETKLNADFPINYTIKIGS